MDQDEIYEFMDYYCNYCCSHISCNKNDRQYSHCLKEYKKEILENNENKTIK